MPLDEIILTRLANNDPTLTSLDLNGEQLEAKALATLWSAIKRLLR